MIKILIITSCSKKKLPIKAPAKNLYQGQLFKMVKRIYHYQNIDFAIISVKFGLLAPNDIIGYYDKEVRTKSEILRLRKKVLPKLRTLITSYERIIVIMGRNYRKLIQPIVDDRFFFLYHYRGLFQYNKILSHLIQTNINQNFEQIKERRFLPEIRLLIEQSLTTILNSLIGISLGCFLKYFQNI